MALVINVRGALVDLLHGQCLGKVICGMFRSSGGIDW